MRARIAALLVVTAAVGVAIGVHVSTATAGPTLQPGPANVSYFVTNSDTGRTIYVWTVEGGKATSVTENSIEEERRPSGGVTYGPRPKMYVESLVISPKSASGEGAK